MKCSSLIKLVTRLSRAIDRLIKAVPFSDLPGVEPCLRSLQVVPTMIYMTIAPRHFYARISRWVGGKSHLVPSPAVFSSSVTALFIFVLLPGADSLRGRLILILVFVAAPIWIYLLVIFTYAILYSSRGIVAYISAPFWKGPELKIMFSADALKQLDVRLLIRALFYFVPHAIVVGLPFLILPLAVALLGLQRGLRPEEIDRLCGLTMYFACSALTWLVVLPVSNLVLYCSKVPTADVLKLTVFRDLIKLFQDTDNLRFQDAISVAAVRQEWRKVIRQLRDQERKILLTGSDSYVEYLKNRSEVFLEPLYRCFDSKNDAAALEALRTISGARSLLDDQEIGKGIAQG